MRFFLCALSIFVINRIPALKRKLWSRDLLVQVAYKGPIDAGSVFIFKKSIYQKTLLKLHSPIWHEPHRS